MEPFWARVMATEAAMVRTVTQKIASPTPDRGPIKAALMALMEAGSKFSGSAAYSPSMDMHSPRMKNAVSGVQLKNAWCRTMASAIFSWSSP